MSPAAHRCPACGAGLSDTEGKSTTSCAFCGIDIALVLTPIQSFVRMAERRAELDPTMNALMARYAELMPFDKPRSLFFYEAFTYLVVAIGFEVRELHEVEAMVTPLMRTAAQQLGVTYTSPLDRGTRITYAYVNALAAEPLRNPD